MPLPLNRFKPFLLFIAGLFSTLGLLDLLFFYMKDGIPYTTSSGAWMTLAQDWSQGIFYRPLAEDSFFGGTRYMPVFFVVLGELMKMIQDPVIAGYTLSLFCLLLLDVAVFFLLRHFKLNARMALACTLLMHASISLQLLALQCQGDFLASALNLWGVYFGLKARQPGKPVFFFIASIFLTAAFFTKFSSLTGLAALLLFSLKERETGFTLRMFGFTGGMILTGVALLALHPGAEANLLAVGLGEVNLSYALKAPIWFLTVLGRDPFLLALVAMAFWGLWRYPQEKKFLKLFFGITALATMVIFSSQGTDYNHLIDLLAASILILGVTWRDMPEGSRVVSGFAGAWCLALVLSWIPGTPSIQYFLNQSGWPTRTLVTSLEDRFHPEPGTLFSEHPLVPLMWGQRPAVLDPFSLRITTRQFPHVREAYDHYMDSVQTVVLMDWSGAPLQKRLASIEQHTTIDGKPFYETIQMPSGFLEILKKEFRPSYAGGTFVVFERIGVKTSP